MLGAGAMRLNHKSNNRKKTATTKAPHHSQRPCRKAAVPEAEALEKKGHGLRPQGAGDEGHLTRTQGIAWATFRQRQRPHHSSPPHTCLTQWEDFRGLPRHRLQGDEGTGSQQPSGPRRRKFSFWNPFRWGSSDPAHPDLRVALRPETWTPVTRGDKR